MVILKRLCYLSLFSLFLSVPSIAADKVDSALPDYTKASGVSGNVSSVGSDTLANLMTFWAEEFKNLYPNVNFKFKQQVHQLRRQR